MSVTQIQPNRPAVFPRFTPQSFTDVLDFLPVSPAKRQALWGQRWVTQLHNRLRALELTGLYDHNDVRAAGLADRNSLALARYQARVRAYQDAQRQAFWPVAKASPWRLAGWAWRRS